MCYLKKYAGTLSVHGYRYLRRNCSLYITVRLEFDFPSFVRKTSYSFSNFFNAHLSYPILFVNLVVELLPVMKDI